MNTESLIQEFKQKPWKPWLHRRFDPLVTYLMMTHATREAFESQGIHGYFPIALYDTDDWYGCDEMFERGAKEAERYLQEKNIFELTVQCETILENGRKAILEILQTAGDPVEQYASVIKIISPANVYIWVAHGSEPYYYKKIRDSVQHFVSAEELEKFIGDISFPSKMNALARMEEDIRTAASLQSLHERYAWIKARGGFGPGYTLEEIKEIQQKVFDEPKKEKHLSVHVPKEIETLVKEVQELVYLRTLRTDVLYELYYLARPIFERVEKHLGIESVKDYLPEDIVNGNLNKIPHGYAMVKYDDGVLVTHSIILQETVEAEEVQGVIAHKGIARGKVKIVRMPSEMEKVEEGDILVTNMTTPAYLSAMKRAAAFVTDEGGITCHAAILAREMKKPCVIGTKIATKVFKDWDFVEVDAMNGTVKKL